MIEHFYKSIDGNSLDILPFYAMMVDHAQDGARFVELGAYKGRSAAFMAVELRNSGKAVTFFVVDLWEHAADITRNASHPYEPATLEECKANVDRAGYQVRYLQSDTVVAASVIQDQVDFVFIDGDHSYDGVIRDIKAWLPKVKPGGVIAGHDLHYEYPGVVRAVREVFGADYKQSGIVWAHMVPQP
jgi:predicted O-methyltransferase YrrM